MHVEDPCETDSLLSEGCDNPYNERPVDAPPTDFTGERFLGRTFRLACFLEEDEARAGRDGRWEREGRRGGRCEREVVFVLVGRGKDGQKTRTTFVEAAWLLLKPSLLKPLTQKNNREVTKKQAP